MVMISQMSGNPCDKYNPPECGLPVIELCNKYSPPNCGEIKGKGALGNKYRKRMYYEGNNRKKLVETLQNMLVALCYDIGPFGVDGDFGDDTEKAVIKFQKQHKDWKGEQLKDDGLVGPRTADALNRAMVGIWYDHYQTPVKLTSVSVLLTATAEALKHPISIEIEEEKKGRVVITTPLPEPKPHKKIIECETWDGWKAANARYVIILKNGKVKGLASEETNAYVTDDEGRIKPEHITSDEFKLFIFPPKKIYDIKKLKVKRDEYKYVYSRSGTGIRPQSDSKILVPYGECVNIAAAGTGPERYRIICNLNFLILAPSPGYSGIVQNDYI